MTKKRASSSTPKAPPTVRKGRESLSLGKLFKAAKDRIVGIEKAALAKLHRTKAKPPPALKDGDHCKVIGGTHVGKSGVVRDIKTGKTGHVSITVVQRGGQRFKTLAKNVVVIAKP